MNLDEQFPANTYRGKFHKQLMIFLSCIELPVNLYWSKNGTCHISFTPSWDKICTIAYGEDKITCHYFGFNEKAYFKVVNRDDDFPQEMRKHMVSLAHHVANSPTLDKGSKEG